MRIRALLIGSTLWLAACSDAATVSGNNTTRIPRPVGVAARPEARPQVSGGASGGSASGGGTTTGGGTLDRGRAERRNTADRRRHDGIRRHDRFGRQHPPRRLDRPRRRVPREAVRRPREARSPEVPGRSREGRPRVVLATGGIATGGTPPACTTTVGSLKPPYTFPQNFKSSYCIYPTTACSDQRAHRLQPVEAGARHLGRGGRVSARATARERSRHRRLDGVRGHRLRDDPRRVHG